MATEAPTSTPLVTLSLPALPIADSSSSQASQDEAEAAVETPAPTPLPPQQTGQTMAQNRSITHPAVPPVTPPPLYQQPRASSTQSDIESNSSSRSSYRTIAPNKPSFQYYLQFRLSGSLEEVQREESPTPKTASSTDTIPAKTTTSTLKLVWWFFVDVIFRQVYWHLILRVPDVYWSRVERIISDADISEPEIAFAIFQERNGKRVKNSAASLCETVAMNKVRSRSKRFDRLHNSWDHFLSSAMREWKIMNLVSVLLLGAIASLLQIQVVSNDPFVRTAAFISMLCALMSLLYGCLYSICFFDLKKSYKALQWAAEAHKNQLNPFWNIWVFMAMPAIWLVWSLIAYLVCFMTYMWRAGGDGLVANPRGPLGLRVLVTCILCLGLLYLFLIVRSLRQYGRPMEDGWRKRVHSLSEVYYPPHLASVSDSNERKSVYHDGDRLTPEKANVDLLEEFTLDHETSGSDSDSDSNSAVNHPGSGTSHTSTRPLIIAVNAPDPRLKSAIKDSSDSQPQLRRVRFAPNTVDTIINTRPPWSISQDNDIPSIDAVEKELPSSDIPSSHTISSSNTLPSSDVLSPTPAQLPSPELLDDQNPSPPTETGCAGDVPHQTLTTLRALAHRAEVDVDHLPPCVERPVPDDMEPLDQSFGLLRLFSLDPQQIVTLPFEVDPALKRRITSEDVKDFLSSAAIVFPLILDQCDDPLVYCACCVPFLTLWNERFFLKRGLLAVIAFPEPELAVIRRLPDPAIYLCNSLSIHPKALQTFSRRSRGPDLENPTCYYMFVGPINNYQTNIQFQEVPKSYTSYEPGPSTNLDPRREKELTVPSSRRSSAYALARYNSLSRGSTALIRPIPTRPIATPPGVPPESKAQETAITVPGPYLTKRERDFGARPEEAVSPLSTSLTEKWLTSQNEISARRELSRKRGLELPVRWTTDGNDGLINYGGVEPWLGRSFFDVGPLTRVPRMAQLSDEDANKATREGGPADKRQAKGPNDEAEEGEQMTYLTGVANQ